MFRLLYDIVIHLIWLFFLPSAVFKLVFRKKYNSSFFKRLGFGFPDVPKNKSLIWIHAVSVGETKAIVSLVKIFKKKLPTYSILLSSVTETGHVEALKILSEVDYHVFLPLDFSYIIKPILRRVNPELVIICETDFWFRFLYEANDLGAKIILVNGKISDKSMQRYSFLPFFGKKLFNLFDCLCVQNKSYMCRFTNMGVPIKKVKVTGNLKFDDVEPMLTSDLLDRFRKRLHIVRDQKIVVIGSTHEGEEKLLINAIRPLFNMYTDLKVFIAPRHPQRFDQVKRLIKKMNIPFGNIIDDVSIIGNEKIILINVMGMLKTAYQIANVAIVAGSFVKGTGGHNILEPVRYGVPVIFGEYMHSQQSMVELVLENNAGLQTDIQHIGSVLKSLLDDDVMLMNMGKSGMCIFNHVGGAVDKTWENIKSVILNNF